MTMHDEDDFRAAMLDVEPLQKKPRAQPPEQGDASRSVTPAQLERRQAALGNKSKVDANPLTLDEVPQRQPRELLEWKQDGVQHGVFARLRAGKYPLEASLDLHGKSVKEARTAVYHFISRARGMGWRAVIIAHGRGEKSATPARMKSFVAAWLEALSDVIAYSSAQRHHGGTGAVYALLKKSPAAKQENSELHGGR